jgi:hypothetical protein
MPAEPDKATSYFEASTNWTDVHRQRLFGRATWLRLFGEVRLAASLAPRTIEGGEYDSFIAFHDAPQTRDP